MHQYKLESLGGYFINSPRWTKIYLGVLFYHWSVYLPRWDICPGTLKWTSTMGKFPYPWTRVHPQCNC